MIPQTFQTQRLVLRPVDIQDADFILELLNSPGWIKYIGDRNVKSLQDAQEYIETKMLPQLKRLGYGNYLVIRQSDKAKIGTCGLYDREGLEGIDIGFAFLEQYGGQGYAFEAAHKIKTLAFESFGLKTINGITIKENKPSQRLLEKLGLEQKGIIKLPNDPADLLHYQLSVS